MDAGRFRRWRWIAGAAQALVALGLPFVTVGGESALRLDVPAGRLHAFGASYTIDEAFVVLAATLLATAGLLLVTLLFGRVWCGWACPQTVLGELTAWVEPPLGAALARGGDRSPAKTGRRRWRRPAGFVAAALVSAVVAADVLWYFVSPYDFLARLSAGTLGPTLGGSWAALFAILFLDLAFVRARFCATICPYAKLQGVTFDRSTLVVAYDAGRDRDCVDCGACVRVCPTGIDIRDGLQAECIACAACVDACTPIMARLGRAPDLVGYFFGEPGGRARPLRPAALGAGAVTLAAAVLLVAVVAARSLLDLTALPDDGFRPRRAPDGRAMNAYAVALENRGRAPMTVALELAVPGGAVTLRPEEIALAAGERRQVRVVAAVAGLPPGRAQGELSARAVGAGGAVERRSQRLALVVPEVAP